MPQRKNIIAIINLEGLVTCENNIAAIETATHKMPVNKRAILLVFLIIAPKLIILFQFFA